MNTVVFVLVVISSNGHWFNPVVPTLEFKTREKCEIAIKTFKEEAKENSGDIRMRCVRIEK